jgi:hypothetical protein
VGEIEVPRRKIQPETQLQSQLRGLVEVEEVTEEELKRLEESKIDIHTRVATEIVNAVANSSRPLKFRVSEELNFIILLRKLSYRVRRFNKTNPEYRITYRVYRADKLIVAWKERK